MTTAAPSACPVNETTPLITFLELLQDAAFATFGPKNFDSKFYIDLSLRFSLPVVEKAFNSLPRSRNGTVPLADLEGFIAEYFRSPGEDLVVADLPDYVPAEVKHPGVRSWALEIHALWKNLSRGVTSSVRDQPELHTLLPLPEQFVIPGSRFREVYYWDSYWVIRGLLASKMYETAKGIVTNLIYLLDTYGHVLNGARVYYTNRRQDKEFASNISSGAEKRQFYREVATAAESGWDFSTRWMRNLKDITTLTTTSILPVDLNAYILGMELDISFLSKVAGNHSAANHFLEASKAQEKAIRAIFWNDMKGQWFDYWLDNHSSCKEAQLFEDGKQNQAAFASNFIPLWIEPFSSDKKLTDKVVSSLRTSGLLLHAGIATSLTNSGQQWDFPNGWAPVQHMIVEGLASSGSSDAKSLAEEIMIRWIRTNYAAYKKMGVMYEKYDVEKCGAYGGGGKFVAQTGFGWSNGVVLAFLEEFGWPQDREIWCQ
ncbi:hypothetical protein CDL15_Pgr027976 [Punica granatum]|uniref:alpha,alpha-trehalase n=1 Tax=Punica granatum TaxID=22663 RepID=A0A218XKH6_PUNGR|nr:hypothetical protein CDL15_Pgr027976 [Punica granatum]